MKLVVQGQSAYIFTGTKELDASRSSVMFVHGAALDHTVWTLPARYFNRHGLNVLGVDLPGHGLSGGKPLPAISEYADWLIQVLDALEIEATALVGHSMGSLIVLDGASRYPQRVRSLALAGTAVPMPVTEQLLKAALKNDHSAIEMLTEWGHSPGAHIGGSETPGMWMIGGLLRLFERSGKGVLFNDLNACNAFTGGIRAAQRVECPVRLILGASDLLTPTRAAMQLADHFRSVEIDILPQTGHTIMSEKPNALLDSLIQIV